MCHIHAASAAGPRFDPNQSEVGRDEPENLIILCPTHHSLVDQDSSTYTAEVLRTIKAQHEERVATSVSAVNLALDDQQAIDFARQVANESVDFAIIVALPKELAAVRKFFPELEHVKVVTSSRSYYRGMIPTARGGSYRVVVTLLHSMGNLEAAHATADLIREWSPRFVLVNGIAGGLSREHQDFGDIVASDTVVYYELAKIRSGGQDRRSRQFSADRTLLDGILNLTSSAWRRRLPPRPDGAKTDDLHPRIHVGPIASGEKVIATVEAADDLRTTQPNLIAVEMESAGVASAAFSAVKNIGFLTIRAICDFADASKNDSWHEYAAQSAASCLRDFVESRPVPLSEGTWPRTASPVIARERSSTTIRKQLFDQLCNAFDMEEFKNLCFLLGIDIDDLPGDRKSARVRELILLLERRQNLDVLEEAVHENWATPDRSSDRTTPLVLDQQDHQVTDRPESLPSLNFECIRAGFIDVEIDTRTFEIQLTPDQYGRGLKCKAAVAEFRRNTDRSNVDSISIRTVAELRGRQGESLSINEGRWLVHDRDDKRRATIPFKRLDTRRLAVVLGISNNKVYTYEGRYVKTARIGLKWIYEFKHELQDLSEAVYDVEVWLAGSYGGRNIMDEHFRFELIRGAELKDSIFRKNDPCLIVPGSQPSKAERIRQLSDLAEEADQIIARGTGVEVDWSKAREWAQRAEAYILQFVNEESAAYFSLETREHAYPGLAVNRIYVDWVYTRTQRIAEIASEVRKE